MDFLVTATKQKRYLHCIKPLEIARIEDDYDILNSHQISIFVSFCNFFETSDMEMFSNLYTSK